MLFLLCPILDHIYCKVNKYIKRNMNEKEMTGQVQQVFKKKCQSEYEI